MDNDKYIEYIKKTLTQREALEQLAEESCELGKASLKLIRALGDSNNKTPESVDKCFDNFIEEITDVLIVIRLFNVLDVDFQSEANNSYKWKRWAERLGYKGGV